MSNYSFCNTLKNLQHGSIIFTLQKWFVGYIGDNFPLTWCHSDANVALFTNIGGIIKSDKIQHSLNNSHFLLIIKIYRIIQKQKRFKQVHTILSLLSAADFIPNC